VGLHQWVPPLMLKMAANPLGLPKDVFNLQAQFAADRSQFYGDLPVAFLWIRPTSSEVLGGWSSKVVARCCPTRTLGTSQDCLLLSPMGKSLYTAC
jgi:hypothetical protein